MDMIMRCMNLSSTQSYVPLNSGGTHELNSERSDNISAMHPGSLPLSSQQFYHQQPNETSNLPATSTYSQSDSSVFRLPQTSTRSDSSVFRLPQTSTRSDSSVFRLPQTSAQSDGSVFRLPQTTRQYNAWAYYKNRIDFLMAQLQQVDDKAAFKFLIRLMENAVHTVQYQQCPNASNPEMLADYILQTFKEKYYSNRIPKSISGTASIISDQTSNIEPYPRVILNGVNNVSRFLPERNNQVAAPLAPVLEMPHQAQSRKKVSSRRPDPVNESSLYSPLFTESQMAQRRDENIVSAPLINNFSGTPMKQATNKPKPNCKRSTEMPMKENCSVMLQSVQNPNSSNLLPQGSKTTSRRGRPIKSPVKFWKGNESHVGGSARMNVRNNMDDTLTSGRKKNANNDKKSVMNESMTLRSNKVVQRISPLMDIKNSKNDTKNKTIESVVKNKETKKKSAPKTKNENKENMIVSKTKRTKKGENADKSTKNVTTNEKNVAQKQKGQALKKVEKTSQKRKFDEPANKVQKKKKVEDVSVVSSASMLNMSDDDLFGEMNYKKSTKPALQIVSPTYGILSVKKAARNNLSKETPPCKTLGLMLDASVRSAASSVVKDAPVTKLNHVIKRVTKVMENNQKNPKRKASQKKGNKKLDIKTLPTATPLTAAQFCIFDVAEELERTEDSDLDEDDDLN